tara:strand:+ start:1027 stop:1230 length:204 start_codon:yes stop_codon:yes gene_type:complete
MKKLEINLFSNNEDKKGFLKSATSRLKNKTNEIINSICKINLFEGEIINFLSAHKPKMKKIKKDILK